MKMKRVFVLTLSLLLILGSVSMAGRRRSARRKPASPPKKVLKLEINGQMQPDNTLVNIQHYEMVPLGLISNLFGYKTEFIMDSKKIVLTKDLDSIMFEKDDNAVFHNGKERLMSTKAIVRNNKVYVPLEVFRLFFNKSIIYNRDLHAMIVTDDPPEADNTVVFGESVPESKFTKEAVEERSSF